MQQHGSNYFACRPPLPTLVMGSIDQKSSFSELGHVAYQIKGDHEMQQHGNKYFYRRTTTLEVGPIDLNSTFSEHIK